MAEARYRHIAADIRARIAAGQWAPGTQIPSRRALALTYGVHHETVRLAIELLRSEGILEGRPKSRLWVTSQSAQRTLIDPDAPWPYWQGDTATGTTTANSDLANRLQVKTGTRIRYWRVERLDPDGRPAMLLTTWRRGAPREHATYRCTASVRPMSQADAEVLGLVSGQPALYIERTRLDGSGEVVETADLVLPADRWSIAI
ncbi:GntR family transcriptional regulator [Streptomyces yunnanensis]|uniref:GntR family transcriptional regulator n=1 Tax=Streptomyces yunnanensis TaxID=156453 RepID=A0A9X8MTG6_9ACTN|nr:GntR family transcriptional regulator [Streptomyces yunnanensis]SHL76659.1 GntR family transcriptional regulator [Streptomyces yunnanensis]